MTSSFSGNMLATLSLANRQGNLTDRVRDLPVAQFVALLEQITREFEHFLRAIDLINNETTEFVQPPVSLIAETTIQAVTPAAN